MKRKDIRHPSEEPPTSKQPIAFTLEWKHPISVWHAPLLSDESRSLFPLPVAWKN